MIETLQLLRNIGCFDSVTAAANTPLSRLTLLYAENGRGKTTLAAILRSLSTGDPIPIVERRRLSAQHSPHIIISFTDGSPNAMFQNGSWSRTVPEVVIYDDVFVDKNVYSGLMVESDHRQNLHELILGAQGVTLNQQLQTLTTRIETHNAELRQRRAAIPPNELDGLSVDDFCGLQQNANIDQEIQTAERNLAACREQEQIQSTPNLELLNLPTLDLHPIEQVLQAEIATLDATAVTRVQEHLASVGDEAEEWVSLGVERQNERHEETANQCVFCDQDLTNSPVITHYRAFFSDAYKDLQQNILDAISTLSREHADNLAITFERAVRMLIEKRQFWSRFANMPEIGIDSRLIIENWNLARDQLATLLNQKKAAPLNAVELSDDIRAAVVAYESHRTTITSLNEELTLANQTIATVKEQAAAANQASLAQTLSRLKAVKSRYIPVTATLCTAYLSEKQAKTVTEGQRNQARDALDQYRETVFPVYENAINHYLSQFNAGYRLDSVNATNTRTGPSCTYNVLINNTPVPVGGGNAQPGTHSFRNVLSAGDRNALALAFFLASLELDPNLADKIVVIDDPVSSLDEHRSLTTVQEIRRLTNQVSQLIVLSHAKPFLCRLWAHTDPAIRSASSVVRDGDSSTIVPWNVNNDSVTENDRRHVALREYIANGGNNEREIASSIRPSLEAFFRVAYPEYFPPGTLLGPFRGICNQRMGTPQEILSQPDINELQDIVDYANRFHHDTNPSWETEAINSAELLGFVERALGFAKRP